MKRFLLVMAVLAVLAASVAGALAYGARQALMPAQESADPVDFVIQRGATLKSVAAELERRELVRHATAFEWLARWKGVAGNLQVGEFEISASMRPEEILSRFEQGRVKTYPVVIPEGFAAREIAARLAKQELADAAAFLAVVDDPASPERFGVEGPGLEGYLFPETYRFPRGLPADEVVRVLVDHFLEIWQEVEVLARQQKLGMREVATLASIVEKETGARGERPLIAAVFRNRLTRGMRLESDPTTIYGIADFDGNLRRVDLEDGSNPYNTYKIAGLPPGPIANPGAGAIRAVVSPADTDYLYFVSRNDGTHVFSRTYPEHERNVDRYQRKRRRRR